MAPSHLGDRPPGRLATMACPRGGDWLDGEMEGLSAQGVDVLVSALTYSELVELSLTCEPELAAQAGPCPAPWGAPASRPPLTSSFRTTVLFVSQTAS